MHLQFLTDSCLVHLLYHDYFLLSITIQTSFFNQQWKYQNFYTLYYIDKMWGIMRKEAFPEKIIL